jgi:uncharacterized protein YjbI with pentapeptide repeats
VPDPGAPAGDTTPLRDLTDAQVAAVLAAHELWLTSGGKEGARADLSRGRLRKHRLRDARLEEVDLTEARLQEADLSGANLRGATLRGAKLSRAVLKDTSLRDTDLTDAELDGALDLLAGQLAGADLTRAKLPESLRTFEGLKQADRIADSAQKLYLALLGGCAYSILTIATTTDAKLITNSASSPLPIIQTPVPIAGFFWVAPLLLASVYFYFNLYLQRLWEALAELPAVFPDGVSLDRKVDPWLLVGLIRRHVRRLVSEQPAFARLHTIITRLSVWWAVPVTLFLFWGRYLRRHEWVGTGFQVLLLALSIAGAVLLYAVARATLRRSRGRRALRAPWRWGLAVALAALPLVAISLGAIEGNSTPFKVTAPGTWVPSVARVFRYSVFADLEGAEVSTKPAGWTGRKEQIELVTGATLAKADLRWAEASWAFLIKADLTEAQLQSAALIFARLEGATLLGARLEGAKLRWARLEGADLHDARLDGADLRRARLDGATLLGARLEGADLRWAELRGVDLRGALCLTAEQLEGAYMDKTPSLPTPCPKPK